MNPPAALSSAMSREKKPFSYLPGGLDLSQIKSEKMAMRLKRNALNPGVTEVPKQNLQSPITPTTPIAVPNYNCLPVQVFPSFALPANPKSLLRSRNHPNPPQDFKPESKVNISNENNAPSLFKIEPKFGSNHNNNVAFTNGRNEDINKNTTVNSSAKVSNRPLSMYNIIPEHEETHLLPPTITDQEIKLRSRETSLPPDLKPTQMPSALCANLKNRSRSSSVTREMKTSRSPESNGHYYDTNAAKSYIDDNLNNSKFDQGTAATIPQISESGIKIIEKSQKEKKTEEIEIESQNGDESPDTQLTVTLPSNKLSSPKIETKVDVTKKVLSNGDLQEITTTTTKTTYDGKTEIKTKTETKTFPKEEDEYEEVEEEEEEEGENEAMNIEEIKDNEEDGDEKEEPQSAKLIKKMESSETVLTKHVRISEEIEEISKEGEEEQEDEKDIEFVSKEETHLEKEDETYVSIEENAEVEKEADMENVTVVQEDVEISEHEEIDEYEEEEEEEETKEKDDNGEVEVEEKGGITEEGESEELTINISVSNKTDQSNLNESVEVEKINFENHKESKVNEETEQEELEEEDEQYVEAEEEIRTTELSKTESTRNEVLKCENQEALNSEIISESQKEESLIKNIEIQTNLTQSLRQEDRAKVLTETILPSENNAENNNSLNDIPIKLEEIEDFEIKPIGLPQDTIKKVVSETTEIVTNNTPSLGPLSTKTELHRIENVVVQNRITKTLDRNYEEICQKSIPAEKSYFAPSREPLEITPQPTKTFVPSYVPPEPRSQRHSLLLDRLSVERHIPIFDSTHFANNAEDQTTQAEEPRAEVVIASNVKPSSVTNQQWFHQSKKENQTSTGIVYDSTQEIKQNVATKPQYQGVQKYKSQSEYQPQPLPQVPPEYPIQTQHYQSPATQSHQNSTPLYQYQQTPEFPNQTQYRTSQTNADTLYYQNPHYIPNSTPYNDSYTNNLVKTDLYENSYASLGNTASRQTNPSEHNYSTVQNSSNTNQYLYHDINRNENATQNYSNQNSYVPPPWEQDSSYVLNNTTPTFYQTAPPPLESNPLPSWKPIQPKAKLPKPPPTAYIPPAPNQSFVSPISKADIKPKVPGRKTYYSEYERRYISVPETTYVPTETKVQPQPNPSPQYYYDNDEPIEKEEPSWRKELREFSEKKTYSVYGPEQNNVKPPWEAEATHVKTPSNVQYTPTPTWSQTLKPRLSQERSFEADYTSQEWPKNNTVGRSRPVSAYAPNSSNQRNERSRGVSVDRYNPNNYHSPTPTEHPPVQSHTLTPLTAPQHKIHNRRQNSRASAEPRELSAHQPRMWGDSRSSPIQSRSFKYLQWITGTDE